MVGGGGVLINHNAHDVINLSLTQLKQNQPQINQTRPLDLAATPEQPMVPSGQGSNPMKRLLSACMGGIWGNLVHVLGWGSIIYTL